MCCLAVCYGGLESSDVSPANRGRSVVLPSNPLGVAWRAQRNGTVATVQLAAHSAAITSDQVVEVIHQSEDCAKMLGRLAKEQEPLGNQNPKQQRGKQPFGKHK